MFGALSAGLTGTPSMSGFKSKGEALKYAIEFATQWKDGEKIINYPAAEELYNFICKHVELPETFDDGLSSFFKRVGETIEEEKRNREKLEELKNSLRDEEVVEEPDVAEKETQDEEMEKVCEDEELAEVDLTVEGFVEGEDPVNEESEPTGEVIVEQTKEEAIPLPGSSPLSPVANKLRSILRDNKFKLIGGAGHNGYSEETFRLHGNCEYLDVTITFSTCPKIE